MAQPNELLIHLLDYIEQVERLKRKAAYTVPDEYFRAFQEDAQGLPGVEFNLVSAGDDVWMRVPRHKEIPPPEPDETLAPWVVLSKSPDKPPELRKELTIRDKDGKESRQTSEAQPKLSRAFEWYTSELWEPWAAAERPRRKTISLYNRLFSLQQVMSTEGAETPLEIVWGIGVALWKRSSSSTVRHPLITQACEVSLNEQTFELQVRPRDVDPLLELDCYAELEVPGIQQLGAFWRGQLGSADHRLSPFEASTYERTLRAAVGHLDPSGAYVETAGRPAAPVATDKLCVTDGWVLFGRKRSEHIFIQDLVRLKRDLKENPQVPPVLAAFVKEGDSAVRARPGVPFRGLSSSNLAEGVRELYFPMPYNDEQVSIIEKLETNDGVVVQGPPGTGKTHTIANVICHFLAQGKRVLVTSKGESALTVLQEKLPEEVRPLSVSLLSDERDGMKQFEHSIQTIASKVNALNPSRLEAQVRDVEARLGELHQRIAAIDHRIAGFASKHMSRIRLAEREVTPEELAKTVLSKEEEHGWLDDVLSSKEHATLQFSDADISALRKARIELGKDLRYLPCTLPAADSFPNEQTVLALHKDLVRAKRIEESVENGQVMALIDKTNETFQRAKELHEQLKEMQSVLARISADQYPWSSLLRKAFSERSDSSLVRALSEVAREVARHESSRKELLPLAVVVPPDAELDREFVEAVERLSKGKSAFLLPFGKRDTRDLLAQVTLSGLKPAPAQDWRHVSMHLQQLLMARQLVAKWNSLAAEWSIAPVTGEPIDAFKEVVALQAHVTLVQDLATRFDGRVTACIETVFGTAALEQMPKEENEALGALIECLAQHLDKARLAYAMGQVNELLSKLEGKSGPVVERMEAFLTRQLGVPELPEDQVIDEWHALLTELRRLASLRQDLLAVERVASLVAQSGAIRWGERLRAIPAEGGSDSLTPSNWLDAWNWRCAKTFLNAIDGRDELIGLSEKRRTSEGDLSQAYRALVAAKTWLGVYNNSPDSIRQALQTYLNAIQAIGAGTGIRAIRHRKTARDAMVRAYKAVPCWIMPQWRVSETIPADVGLFDLVVVDEASQSDIWALPALLRGSKLLVVGDHRQVSPSAVGMAEQKIKELSERFLKEQPHGSQMTPDRSIYDLARVVFAGNSVMLKEHFRCVPAIIEFSNREFYEGDIKPLRIPKRSERLDPPLIDVFVKGGYRKGDVNPPEAHAIVQEIENILADPDMTGRSIGVVTLVGTEQAPFIDKLIHQRISPRDIVERAISVGAPPVFQGRERDIMLMSMVLQKGDRGVATRFEIEQRFNVAASRARDRTILFRSIDESDVNPDGLNARLMRHFKQPFRQDAQKVGALRDLCQSDFEREMFDVLVARNYRVRPQMRVGEYRIDLVVEGADDRRLAIECDGDRFHGPGQWQDDLTRQRVLERAGWTFWRCFASSFVLRRKAVLEDLFQTLGRMGIEPLGSESVDNTMWVAYREIDPLTTSQEAEAEAA